MPDKYGFRFRDWQVYKDARLFRGEINKLLKTYPKEELYSLVDQTKRALNSILLNIAKGSNKNTDKDTRVYVNRAQGSLDEIIACLDCAVDDGYITPKQQDEQLIKAGALAKQLKKFSTFLSSRQGLRIKD